MNPIEKLTKLSEQLVTTESVVEKTRKILKHEEAKLRELKEDILPEVMRETGQDLLKLPTGEYLSIEEKLYARIPKHAAEEAYLWLEENGEGGMIKRAVVCEFRADQEEEAQRALDGLYLMGFEQARIERKHQWNTVESWVKKMYTKGRDLPRELFGVHCRNVAVIKKKIDLQCL